MWRDDHLVLDMCQPIEGFRRQDREPEQREAERPSIVFPPKEGTHEWDLGGMLSSSKDFDPAL